MRKEKRKDKKVLHTERWKQMENKEAVVKGIVKRVRSFLSDGDRKRIKALGEGDMTPEKEDAIRNFVFIFTREELSIIFGLGEEEFVRVWRRVGFNQMCAETAYRVTSKVLGKERSAGGESKPTAGAVPTLH